MFPYLFIFFLATILYYRNIKKTNFLVYFFISVFIGLAGFRDMIGGYDVYIYAEVYESFKGAYLYLYTPFEKGYLTFYYFLQQINESREFLFFATALIMTILHYYSIKKNSNNIGMSLYIYFCKFFLFSFVYMRQGLAMGVIWLAISFLIRKKYFYVLLIVTLTFTIHKSSILFLPFIFIAHKKFSPYQLGLIALIVLFISLTPLSNFFISSIADTTDSDKLATYTEKGGSTNLFYLIEGGLAIYLAIIFHKYFYKATQTTVIFNGFFIYAVTILAGLTNATFIRFSWYYFIFVVLALPYIYTFIKSNNLKSLYKNLLFIYYALVFFRLLIVYDGGDFMPYKSIFQDFDRNGLWEFMEYRQK